LLDDYVIAVAAAVIVAAVVILATMLSKYSAMVEEAQKSTRLAKDVWDSVNSRFSVVDARIIDLMAKTEVLSSRIGSPQSAPQAQVVPSAEARVVGTPARQSEALRVGETRFAVGESTETEVKVLRLLVEGPKTSAQIKDIVGRSREHTARLMKSLFDRGLVVRNDRNKPYVYEITDRGRSYVVS
jgi:predicted HTH transcriptional regulator